MIITAKCSACDTAVEAREESFGASSSCPNCSSEIDIPDAYIGEGVTLGEFSLITRLGQGGMGEVFLAEQLSMGRKVAIKVLPPKMTLDRDAVERFLHEARMAARLEHPNIVTVLDAGEDFGFYYIAMNFVQGNTLEQMVRRHGPLPEQDAIRYMMKVVEALDFGWRHHRILHRDIKPANIMIDRQGDVKLLDMGLAKDIVDEKGLTVAGTILGTPYYMSPEQAKTNAKLDFHSDLYSCGATLFNLLTATPPFEGDGPVNIMTKHVLEEAPNVRTRNPEVSEAAAALVGIMLEKEPDDRQESYGVLLEQMEGTLSGMIPSGGRADSVSIPDPEFEPALESAPPAGKSTRTRFIAAAVLAWLCIGLFALFVMKKPRKEAEPERTKIVENPQVDREQNKLENIRNRLNYLDSYLREYPDESDMVITNLQKLLPEANGTAYESGIRSRLSSLQKKRDAKLADQSWQKIRETALQLEKSGYPGRAIRYLRRYNGSHASLTEKRRQDLAESIVSRARPRRTPGQRRKERVQQTVQNEDARRTREEETRWRKAKAAAMDVVASKILKHDFDDAFKEYQVLLNDPRNAAHKAEVKRQFAGIDLVCQMDRLVLNSFSQDKGKLVRVRLKSGDSRLLIKGVSGDKVKASKAIEGHKGTIGVSFGIADMKVSERARRLGNLDEGDRLLMKAVLYFDSGRPGKSLAALDAHGTPLAKGLEKGFPKAALFSWKQLLELADLPCNETDIGDLRRKYDAKNYASAIKAQIAKRAEAFIDQHSSNRDVAPFLSLAVRMAKSNAFVPKGMKVVRAEEISTKKLGNGAAEGKRLQEKVADTEGLAIELENSIKMRFRLIPTGANWNGLGIAPRKPYYIGKFEITQAQWKRIIPKYRFRKYRADYPMEHIRMDEIKHFLDRLCEAERVPQGTYRLPTNAEWTYACMGNVRERWYFGQDDNEFHRFGNYLDKSAPAGILARDLRDHDHNDGYSMTGPIGKFMPNPWGLYDMHGNVAEYVADGSFREARRRNIVKGGSWVDTRSRSLPLGGMPLGDRLDRVEHSTISFPFGFRVVRTFERP